MLLGEEEELRRILHLDEVLDQVQVFLGLKVLLITDKAKQLTKRLSLAAPRTSAEGIDQVGGHIVLAFLQGVLDPCAACTIAITNIDLYPPQKYDFVTGMTDPGDRIGLYSTARYFQHAMALHTDGFQGSRMSSASSRRTESRPISASRPLTASRGDADKTEDAEEASEASRPSSARKKGRTPEPESGETRRKLLVPKNEKEFQKELSMCFVKVLSRESLKLCGIKECCLMPCLMNPIP
ncbi:unnamed protein product, partial [Polarella glacialis]